MIYLRRREYQKAIPDFTMAIHLRPTFAQPYENRAAASADLSLARGLLQ